MQKDLIKKIHGTLPLNKSRVTSTGELVLQRQKLHVLEKVGHPCRRCRIPTILASSRLRSSAISLLTREYFLLADNKRKALNNLNSADGQTINIHYCTYISMCKELCMYDLIYCPIFRLYMFAVSNVITYADNLCSKTIKSFFMGVPLKERSRWKRKLI